jgi:hypothetical protein
MRIEQLARQAGLRCVQVQLVGDPTYLAFNDALFALSSLFERLTPPGFRVHIVGDYVRPPKSSKLQRPILAKALALPRKSHV